MSNDIIKINKYRTIAQIYPYKSFESEIEIDSNKYYFNIDVNEQEKIDLINNCEWWSYTKSLDNETLDIDEDYINLDDSINNKILNAMLEIWNNSLEWDNTNNWNYINMIIK